ncbi:MAG: glycerate kinase [Acidimicrobiales bacterium]|nr:glycerate kinase [Acidimicrobiales bacterium]
MRVLVCADKFRGTVTAREVGDAVAVGAPELDVVVQPLADGGEGTLEAFGGANRTTTVTGPLGTPVDADWSLRGGRAVIEMARASGLLLAGGPEANDPMEASTIGTGQLIASAAEAGAEEILVGLGGSATTDGGLGALRAMAPLARYRGIRLEVACDVRTTFVDAAAVFGPQKGATPSQVKLLGRRLERLAQVYADEHGVDVRELERAGAAGGLAGGLAAAGATLHDGFSLIADAVELYDQIESADLVVTGEGRLDESSFAGKVVGGVASLAAAAGVPVIAVVGQSALTDPPIPVIDLTERFGERAMADTAATIAEAAASFSDGPWR